MHSQWCIFSCAYSVAHNRYVEYFQWCIRTGEHYMLHILCSCISSVVYIKLFIFSSAYSAVYIYQRVFSGVFSLLHIPFCLFSGTHLVVHIQWCIFNRGYWMVYDAEKAIHRMPGPIYIRLNLKYRCVRDFTLPPFMRIQDSTVPA